MTGAADHGRPMCLAMERLTYQHYEIARRPDGSPWELGRGAMGVTYKALDTNLHAPVALKVIARELLPDARARTRFLREARAAAQLRHTNVAAVYHLGQEAEGVFYTMELIEGETTEALVRRAGPLDAPTALRIAEQAARALQAAHARGLLHRDLKPSNLMVLREGGDLLVKVIDFGLVKPLEGDDGGETAAASASLSRGLFLGTPLYASPEQCAQDETIDARADFYSLGATLWFLLTGNPPFRGSTRTVIAQHLSKPPPVDEELAPQPPAVRELLHALLAKEPAERPPDAGSLRQRLGQILRELETSPPPAPAAPAAPPTPAPPPARESFRLAEVLAARGNLPPGEVAALLFPLAALLDGAAAAGRSLPASPNGVRVHLPPPSGSGASWRTRPVPDWSAFELEIDPAASAFPPAHAGSPARALAALVAAALAVDPSAKKLHALLRDAQADAGPAAFPSAAALAIALAAVLRRASDEALPPVPVAPGLAVPPASGADPAETVAAGTPSPPPPPPIPKKGCLPLLFALALLLAGGGVWFIGCKLSDDSWRGRTPITPEAHRHEAFVREPG